MHAKLCYDTNPFESPLKAKASSTAAKTPHTRNQQPDVLATADLLLEQIKELETLCSTVEERVQRKRHALKELEHLIFGSNESPRSPTCPTNTPISSRLHLVSPRLRGLFDLRGPGQANLDAIQTCLDYSPEIVVEDNVSTREDPGHSGSEWVDDGDEEVLLCPFDDKYAVRVSPRKEEKTLPAIPSERLESKIPRKVHVRRQVSTTKRGAVTRSSSNRRRSSLRTVKVKSVTDLTTKGTMRRGSWKRSILDNVKTRPSAIENESVTDSARASRKEKKRGLWSIYSVV